MSVTDDIVEYIVELCEKESRLELSREVLLDILNQYKSEFRDETTNAIAEKLISEGITVV